MATLLNEAVEQAIVDSVVAEPTEQEECVQRGVALLDEKIPGWANEIDLTKFDLRSGTKCVVGQLYGDFRGGCVTLLRLRSEYEAFDIGQDYGFVSEGIHEEWDVLEDIWRKVIAERQS